MIENTAQSADQFNEQARSFAAKAKANGADDIGIMNTIKFMYGLFQHDQAQKITPYQREYLDMTKEQFEQGGWEEIEDAAGNTIGYYNPRTGEEKKTSLGSTMGGLGDLDTGSTSTQQAQQTYGPTMQEAGIQPGPNLTAGTQEGVKPMDSGIDLSKTRLGNIQPEPKKIDYFAPGVAEGAVKEAETSGRFGGEKRWSELDFGKQEAPQEPGKSLIGPTGDQKSTGLSYTGDLGPLNRYLDTILGNLPNSTKE